MKKLLHAITALVALFAAGALFALPVAAEGEADHSTWIQVSPTAVRLNLEPGQDITPGSDSCPNEIDAGCAIEVKNSGTEPFTFRIYASPYVVTGENYELSFSADSSTSYTQIYRWISFQDESGNFVPEIQRSINPGETVTIFDETSVTEKIVFLCPIWFLFLVLLIIFFVIFWLVSRARSRHQAAKHTVKPAEPKE